MRSTRRWAVSGATTLPSPAAGAARARLRLMPRVGAGPGLLDLVPDVARPESQDLEVGRRGGRASSAAIIQSGPGLLRGAPKLPGPGGIDPAFARLVVVPGRSWASAAAAPRSAAFGRPCAGRWRSSATTNPAPAEGPLRPGGGRGSRPGDRPPRRTSDRDLPAPGVRVRADPRTSRPGCRGWQSCRDPGPRAPSPSSGAEPVPADSVEAATRPGRIPGARPMVEGTVHGVALGGGRAGKRAGRPGNGHRASRLERLCHQRAVLGHRGPPENDDHAVPVGRAVGQQAAGLGQVILGEGRPPGGGPGRRARTWW